MNGSIACGNSNSNPIILERLVTLVMTTRTYPNNLSGISPPPLRFQAVFPQQSPCRILTTTITPNIIYNLPITLTYDPYHHLHNSLSFYCAVRFPNCIVPYILATPHCYNDNKLSLSLSQPHHFNGKPNTLCPIMIISKILFYSSSMSHLKYP